MISNRNIIYLARTLDKLVGDQMKKVKIIQIAISDTDNSSTLYALTNDGRILVRGSSSWIEEKVPDLDKPSKNRHYWIEDIDKKSDI